MSQNPGTFSNIAIKPRVSSWRGLSRIDELDHAALIEWLDAYGGELEGQLFQMSRQDLVDLMNQYGREIPANLMGIKDWLAPLDKGARLETWQFASENLGGRFPLREHCKNDAKVRQNCEYVQDCGKESGRCWWSYVKCLWEIARNVANGNIPTEEEWESLQEMKTRFVSKLRRTYRTRTDEEAAFAHHIFYIDDPNDEIEEERAASWAKTQWLVESTYSCKPHQTLWKQGRKIADGLVSSCPEGGYLKMARIEDIVDEAVAADPKSSLRNLKHYELAGAEFEWRDCTQRVPEKGEIQGPGGDMINPDQVGKDDCFVVVNGKFYRVYDEAYFEAEYKRWNYDRYAPPAQCLDLLRDVYDEEFFNYVKRFKRKKGVTGSLIAGKPIEYPEDYRPEFSSEFCYFGSKPRFCRMRPCPVFSSEQYSFNQEHTKALHEEWKKTGVGLWPFEPPHYHEVNSSRLCTKVTNILRPREEKDEAIRDMGFPVLHAALNGVLEEIKTLTKEGKNTCAYCGAQVEQGREYCPSTIRRECYDAYYDDVKRPKLKPVNSTGDRGVALTD